MVDSRSLRLKRSLSRITFRQEKGVPTDYPPVPPLDTDNIEPVFERPVYLQPLAARSLTETASTSKRTSTASPVPVPASSTRTELFSRSIDLLAAHQSLARAQQRRNNTATEETSGLFPNKADILGAHHLVMHQEPTASPAKPEKMFTQAKMVLVEQTVGNGSNPTTSQLSLVTTTSNEQQTLDRSGFLKRIFSRQNKSPRSRGPSEQSQDGEFDFDQSNSIVPAMGPSPHTHPLLSKPYARDEFLGGRPQSKLSNRLPESALSIARKKGEQALASRTVSMRSVTSGLPESNSSQTNLPESSNNNDPGEGETAATDTAIGIQYVKEWGFFVRCYAEGRFNVSNPPDPPPRPSNFNYLIAPTPPNELERLRAVEQINVNYPDWATSKAQHLVHLARKVFGTCYASISFVDGHDEIFKAEYGYQTSLISRSASIGAHVLLSPNSMVILDAGKDWRLRENPLVAGAPHIGFYAGAPLTTPEGYVVGVFAIFDTKPRNDFPLHFCRKLADFTKIANADIEILIEEQEMSNKDAQEMLTQQSNGSTVAEHGTRELSIRSNRITTKLLQNIEEESKQAQRAESVGTEARTDAMEGTISHDLFVRGDKPEEEHTDFPEPLNVPNKQQARPWNAGSAVAITPPETPSRTSAASNESSSLKQTVSTPSGTNRSLSLSSDYDRPYVSRKHRKNIPRALKDASKLGPRVDMVDDQQHPRSPGPVSSLAEAGFALSLIAGTLSYDLVYLLRVRPNPGWEGTEYTEFDSLSTRILVAHGLPQPEPVFDPFIHLRALRSEGGVIYQNPNQGSGGADDDLGYGVGVLLPLLRDNIDELPLICTTNADDTEQEGAEHKALTAAKIEAYSSCRGGVVLAAFKKRPGPGHDFSNEEVAYLREMGCGMKDIFIKQDVLPGSSSGEV